MNDGTKVSTFINTDLDDRRQLIGSPNNIMSVLQSIFYNSEFTKENAHKVINDLLWEKTNGLWWQRNPIVAKRLKKLH